MYHSIPGFSYLLFIFLVLISCRQKPRNKKVEKIESALTQTYLKKATDTVLGAVSEKVDGQMFTITCTTGYKLFVLNHRGDTIFNSREYSSNFYFRDFDQDGYKDIYIDYLTNIPGIQDVLLYDKLNKTYKVIDTLTNYPDAKNIINTKYYYSYHRAGCADMDWASDLFYIKNFRVIKIGSIYGYECGDRDEKDGLYIYKVKNNKESKLETLRITAIYNYKEAKWGFIDAYWKKNYRLFL